MRSSVYSSGITVSRQVGMFYCGRDITCLFRNKMPACWQCIIIFFKILTIYSTTKVHLSNQTPVLSHCHICSSWRLINGHDNTLCTTVVVITTIIKLVQNTDLQPTLEYVHVATGWRGSEALRHKRRKKKAKTVLSEKRQHVYNTQ